MSNESSLSLPELSDRIAILQDNIRQLVEQAAGASGERSEERIASGIYLSPCPESIPLSEITGSQIYCKLDYLQRTGSFKERGARNAMLLLNQEQQAVQLQRYEATATSVQRSRLASWPCRCRCTVSFSCWGVKVPRSRCGKSCRLSPAVA